MEIPCTHTSPTALISWSGRRNAGHRLSRRENCSGMHGAGMSPSPESFEEPDVLESFEEPGGDALQLKAAPVLEPRPELEPERAPEPEPDPNRLR